MKDLLFFIYFSIMGLFGLFCYFLMLLGMILYYPIWRIKNPRINRID